MAKRFHLSVTPEDVAKAKVGDSYRCMVAQAIARQVPDARRIDVDTQTVRWSDSGGRRVFLTPYEVAGYIIAFDAGEEIHPFSFQLRRAIPTHQKKAVAESAKVVNRTRNEVAREKQRAKKAEQILADPDAAPERVAAAKEIVARAPQRIEEKQEQYEGVRAAYKVAGERTSPERVSDETRKPPPRVFRTKRREYGARVLRVNQGEGRKHYANT